jgi:hypothetical protein
MHFPIKTLITFFSNTKKMALSVFAFEPLCITLTSALFLLCKLASKAIFVSYENATPIILDNVPSIRSGGPIITPISMETHD